MDWKLLFLCSIAIHSGFSETPSQALQKLIDGNRRYTKNELLHVDHSSDQRNALLQEQKPFATLVSCSDSRVIPEILFDQGVGDLFVVRVAGNVVGPIELDSIDFSAKVLGSSLIVVLGHEACGAVQAVLEKNTADIEHVAALIQPALKKTMDLDMAIKANVKHVVASLKKSPLLKRLIDEKKLECIGAYYKITTGTVELL